MNFTKVEVLVYFKVQQDFTIKYEHIRMLDIDRSCNFLSKKINIPDLYCRKITSITSVLCVR